MTYQYAPDGRPRLDASLVGTYRMLQRDGHLRTTIAEAAQNGQALNPAAPAEILADVLGRDRAPMQDRPLVEAVLRSLQRMLARG